MDMPYPKGSRRAACGWSCEWRPGPGRPGHVQEDRAAGLTTRGSVTKGGEWDKPSAFAPEADTSH